ncbi:MAG: DHH family phosphoesterase [Anaerolineae bacterium]|nr:DHH family phosphoesterase [Anaerolineae bacterium]
MPTTARRWEVASRCPKDVSAGLSHLHPLLIQALYNRGIFELAEVKNFLEPPAEFRDPFGMKGVAEAVARIRAAIAAAEPIVVYGDFDADGVTSTALLVQALRAFGARVTPYIPHRIDEGYGLHNDSLDRVAATGAKLVITVDCGIRSPREVAHGQSLGMDMIVTDHHSIQKDADGRDILPPALAVINPKQQGDEYPFKDLAGVGIAFKLAQALVRANRDDPFVPDLQLKTGDLLDLVALGTVADIAPLVGENRLLVRRGLDSLNGTVRTNGLSQTHISHRGPRRPGLRALFGEASLQPGKVNAQTIGFVIGPRLNAAGRLSTAEIGYQLLSALTEAEARAPATELGRLNTVRQEMTRATVELAKQRLAEAGDAKYLNFVADDKFHPGVVGLVAGRLTEDTHALDDCRELLVRHGGHSAAAGFTIRTELLPELRARLERIAEEKLSKLDLAPVLKIDAELDLAELDFATCARLGELEPHGEANPQPVFVTHGVNVAPGSVKLVGKEGQHLKFRAYGQGARSSEWEAIAFRMGELAQGLPGRVDLAYCVEINDFTGRPQLTVKDLRPAS